MERSEQRKRTSHTPPPPAIVLSVDPSANVLTNDADQHHMKSQQSRSEYSDRYLLEHFIQYVMPNIFPILESSQQRRAGSEHIERVLQRNSIYSHYCRSMAALHIESVTLAAGQDLPRNLDHEITRHQYTANTLLHDALKHDKNHQHVLEALLGLIFSHRVVCRPEGGQQDIAWHQHFPAIISMVQKLDLTSIISDSAAPVVHAPFDMAMVAWIDILGATMLGEAPTFAHFYRGRNVSRRRLGLCELMGCEDRVMYLISEIACLDYLKRNGMDDHVVRQYVFSYKRRISQTMRLPFNANGALSSQQLSKDIISAFRIAASIYLCSLRPGFSPLQFSHRGLVQKLATVLRRIPAGPGGYDRSLVWVYLIGGAFSVVGSDFRALFDQRVSALGDLASYGSFGCMKVVLREVWLQNEQLAQSHMLVSVDSGDVAPYIHWRNVMQTKKWDCLLI